MRQHGSEATSITISARDVVVSLACTFVQSSLDVYEASLLNNGFTYTRC